jgi:hypothetical protein
MSRLIQHFLEADFWGTFVVRVPSLDYSTAGNQMLTPKP